MAQCKKIWVQGGAVTISISKVANSPAGKELLRKIALIRIKQNDKTTSTNNA